MATNITEFSYRCQNELPGCPLALINQKVVDAIIAFCRDTSILNYGFEYDILSTDVDTADNNAVTLDLSTVTGNPYLNKRPIGFVDYQGGTEGGFKIDGSRFPTEYLELSTNITDYENIRYGSTRYFSFPSNTEVKIWPMEVQDAALYLHLAFKPIVGITTIDDFIFEDHHEAIEAHTKWILMNQNDKKWSNTKQAILEWDRYAEKMGFARIEITQGRTQKSITMRARHRFC